MRERMRCLEGDCHENGNIRTVFGPAPMMIARPDGGILSFSSQLKWKKSSMRILRRTGDLLLNDALWLDG